MPVNPSSSAAAAAAAPAGEGAKVWPEYLVFFAQLEDVLRGVVAEAGVGRSAYRECWRGWNSWAHDDWRRRGDMVVWCLR